MNCWKVRLCRSLDLTGNNEPNVIPAALSIPSLPYFAGRLVALIPITTNNQSNIITDYTQLHNSRRLKTKNKMFIKAVAMVFASKIQGRSRYGTIFAILLTL
jgi:hypothetical protein